MTAPAVSSPIRRRLGVLISGRGSNLAALISAVEAGTLDAEIGVVISNNPGVPGLERAKASKIEALVMDHRGWPSRDDYDAALARELLRREVGLVCLAGFMRRIGPALLTAFPQRILNIHPSLLPSFPGVDAQGQALAHGVRVSGVTVHLVAAGLDDGPIVLQRSVPVLDGDTPETLGARILVEEHKVYPDAVSIVLDGGWRVEGRRFVLQRAIPR